MVRVLEKLGLQVRRDVIRERIARLERLIERATEEAALGGRRGDHRTDARRAECVGRWAAELALLRQMPVSRSGPRRPSAVSPARSAVDRIVRERSFDAVPDPASAREEVVRDKATAIRERDYLEPAEHREDE